MKGDLLKISRIMAILAILLCGSATLIAYFAIQKLEFAVIPLLGLGILTWVLSVSWFLWGWLKNANESGNERRGISASSYILAFIPLCYCFLMATDDSRTKILVKIYNQDETIGPVMIYGEGTIFLNQDTMRREILTKGEILAFNIKAITAPGVRGVIVMEGIANGKHFKKQIAGPFTINPMNIQTKWRVDIDPGFLP